MDTVRFGNIMRATAVEMAAIEAAEARADAAADAQVVAELEAQVLRAELRELARVHAATRRALADATAYIRRSNGAAVELLEHLMPSIHEADWRQRHLIANAYEALEMPEQASAAFPSGTIRRAV